MINNIKVSNRNWSKEKETWQNDGVCSYVLNVWWKLVLAGLAGLLSCHLLLCMLSKNSAVKFKWYSVLTAEMKEGFSFCGRMCYVICSEPRSIMHAVVNVNFVNLLIVLHTHYMFESKCTIVKCWGIFFIKEH